MGGDSSHCLRDYAALVGDRFLLHVYAVDPWYVKRGNKLGDGYVGYHFRDFGMLFLGVAP